MASRVGRRSIPRGSTQRRRGMPVLLSGVALAFTARSMAFSMAAKGIGIMRRGGQLHHHHPVARRSFPGVRTEVRGEEGTATYRRFFVDSSGNDVSPWHDLPLDSDHAAEKYMVTEIPKMTRSKMEIATREPGNPIAQDTKKGQLRDYHGPIYWNYGYLPKTWEDPGVMHPELGVFGDDDPLDVVEIGGRTHEQGEISRVKVLGALAMIDGGELDWKIIAVDSTDEMAAGLQSVADVEAKIPGVISGIREWFRWYKTPGGSPLNSFGFDEVPLGRDEALDVIAETHEAWQRLRRSDADHGLWMGAVWGKTRGESELKTVCSSADVVMFERADCPFCAAATNDLNSAGIPFKSVRISEYHDLLIELTGQSSAPSVWVRGQFIGGYNDGPEGWMGLKPLMSNGQFQEMVQNGS